MKKLTIVLLACMILLAACGPKPEPVSENVNIRVDCLGRGVCRIIDVETGMVCYDGNAWGQCFLLSETRLDY